MTFEDEKDYIMRIIKEMVRVLFSLMLGKKYVAVEMEKDATNATIAEVCFICKATYIKKHTLNIVLTIRQSRKLLPDMGKENAL